MFKANDHHADPTQGSEMGMGKDVRKEFSSQNVVDLVKAQQNAQDRRKHKVDQGRGHIPVQPVSAAQPGENS